MDRTLTQSDTTTAVMFTNNLGQVIFVDQAFLDLMQYSEAGLVTGEPLFKALRLDAQSGKVLLETVRQNGTVQDKLVEIASPKGTPIHLSVNAAASHDAQGNFIGADITLRKHDGANTQTPKITANPAEPLAVPSTNVMPTREVIAEATFADNNQFLQLYFMTHIKAIYVLYQRVIGLMARDRLDKMINQTAQKNGWQLQIRSGLFSTDLNGTTPDMYRVLLREILAYGVRMVGERLIAREIDKVDQQMHEGVRVLAQQGGLYQLYRQK
jgi:hypothetical protein